MAQHMNNFQFQEERPRPRGVRKPQTKEEEAVATLEKYNRFASQPQQNAAGQGNYAGNYGQASPGGYPPQTPEPDVWYESAQNTAAQHYPQQRPIEAGMMSDSKLAPPQNYFLRNLLIVGLSLILLLLTGIFIFLLLNRFTSSPTRLDEARFPDRPPVGRHAELLEGLQNMSIFYYPFITGPQTDIEQRFPPTGSLPNLDFATLVDFNVCCTSLTQRFVCMSGSAFNHGSVFLDAIIEHNTTTAEVYLLLWVNSKDLIEVACAVKGFYLGS
jgi:hypothetical protein